MESAFAPGLLGGLCELPVVEAGTEAGSDGLGLIRAHVVTEAVVGEAQGFGEHPALAVILSKEGVDALLPVAAAGADLVFEIVEGDEGQDGVTEFRVFVLVDPPETFWVKLSKKLSRNNYCNLVYP